MLRQRSSADESVLRNPVRWIKTLGQTEKSKKNLKRSGLTVFFTLMFLWLFQEQLIHHAQNLYGYVRYDMFTSDHFITDYHSCQANGWVPRIQSTDPRDNKPVRIYNGFTFYSELDLLELRLQETSAAVDYWVLVEEKYTFSGKPKPLYYAENKERFSEFNDRIIHVVLDNSDGSNAWRRQQDARSAVITGLNRGGAEANDLVILGDLDEIPNGKILSLLKRCSGYHFPVTFHMPEYYYDFGCMDEHSHWTRVKMFRRSQLVSECMTTTDGDFGGNAVCPEFTREDPADVEYALNGDNVGLRIRNSGWHLSFFMDFDALIDKLGAYAHTERDTKQNHNHGYLQCLVKKCIHVNLGSHGHRKDPFQEVVPPYAYQQFKEGVSPWNLFFPRNEELESGSGC